MALEKHVVVDQITILEDGQIQVRTATRILEDGVLISTSFRGHVLIPGQDVTNEDARVQTAAAAFHAAQVVADFRAAEAARD